MATLTTAQKTRLRRKISDQLVYPYTVDDLTFTDVELNDIYDEAQGDWNLTIALIAEEMMFSSIKYVDYKQNESDEKLSQMRAAFEKLASYYRGLVSQSNQVKIVGMKSRPPRNKTKPTGW